MKKHLSYSNVAATLALVIAVAGGTTAIAAKVTAPKNSVTTKSIRPHNVTARDLTRMIEVRGESTFDDPAPPNGTFSVGAATASCPAGTRVVTGGGFVNGSGVISITGSVPVAEGWVLSARGDGTNTATLTAIAWCLSKKPQKP